jgi:virulence-associated protein VagC
MKTAKPFRNGQSQAVRPPKKITYRQVMDIVEKFRGPIERDQPADQAMNKPRKITLRGVSPDIEIVHEGGSIILRKIVDAPKFRKIAAEVLARMPKPRKGASVVRELQIARLRGRR